MTAVERQYRKSIGHEVELVAQLLNQLVPERTREYGRVLRDVYFDDLATESFGNDPGHDDVGVEDDPHSARYRSRSFSDRIPFCFAKRLQ